MKSQCTIKTGPTGDIIGADKLKVLLKSLPPNGVFRITAESFNVRDTPANNYYWKALCDIIQPALYDAGHDNIRTKEDAHLFFKNLLRVKSTAMLNESEMHRYIEEVVRYCAEFLHICIPSPNTNENFA